MWLQVINMPLHRYTYLIFLLCMVTINIYAKPQHVFQSGNPIANFAWDENEN